MIASTIADGYLSLPTKKSKYPRLAWNMGNERHAKYKAEFFAFIGAKYTEKDNPGFGDRWYSVVTACHPCLSDVFNLTHKNGKLQITKELLGELGNIGWAWVYGDDGSLRAGCSAAFHTEGFGDSGSKVFASSLNDFIGFDCAKVRTYVGGTPKKERFFVELNIGGTNEFFKRVIPHMADGMEYKTIKNTKNRKK